MLEKKNNHLSRQLENMICENERVTKEVSKSNFMLIIFIVKFISEKLNSENNSMVQSLNKLHRENIDLKQKLANLTQTSAAENPYASSAQEEDEVNISKDSINVKYLENDIEGLKAEKKEIQDGYNELMVNYTHLLKKVQEYEKPESINRFVQLAEDHQPLITDTGKEEIKDIAEEEFIRQETPIKIAPVKFEVGNHEKDKEKIKFEEFKVESDKKIEKLTQRLKKQEDNQKKWQKVMKC